ncbi:hypothetical protein B6N60_02826 [Richelia sinica FACHB-800]|uniref:Uncharacterized protein n=1 Tax=Richelia sinica FACHB-800 TaxID=1357546 RepID=A0A975T9U6_9NOST|nr:hypothetical protein B6N60_02826 [Richelia sinica FACHB-800]
MLWTVTHGTQLAIPGTSKLLPMIFIRRCLFLTLNKKLAVWEIFSTVHNSQGQN